MTLAKFSTIKKLLSLFDAGLISERRLSAALQWESDVRLGLEPSV